MNKKKLGIPLSKLDNWEIIPDPSQLKGICKQANESNTENFFNKKKKKWLLLWGIVLILIIVVALKALLNINLIEFFKTLGGTKNVPYFVATLIFGLSTFFVCEVWIRVKIIKLKLGDKLKNVTKFEWFNFSIVAFLIQSITPFSVGSEPYNIWWLTKKGVRARDATAATAASSICWFFSQFLVTWPSFIYLTAQHWDKISTLEISTCYWLVLAGLLVDVCVSIFIFVISSVSKAHFFISKLVNDLKRRLGLQYLTRDELFQKYLQDSTFKNLYFQYLLDKSTIKIVFLYLISNIWVYLIFSLSHRLFFSNVNGESYWDEYVSTWNSYNLINVATTSNNFLPLPSSEGSLQAVLQKLMQDMSSIGSSNKEAVNSLTQEKISELNDSTIFLWRFFCKYLGLFVALAFIFLFGFNPDKRGSPFKDKSEKIRNLQKDGQIQHELIV